MRHVVHFVLALCAFVGVAALVWGLDVTYRRGGSVKLVANTPAVVGNIGTGRVELMFQNLGPNTVCCGYDDDTLNCTTPGANNGTRYKTDQGLVRCVYPDKRFRCLDQTGGSEVTFDEARVVTVTSTATRTATATATPTNTP